MAINVRALRAKGGMKNFRDDLADLIDRGNYKLLGPEDKGLRVPCIVLRHVGHPP